MQSAPNSKKEALSMVYSANPVIHVTGARPNFPKAAPVMRAIEEHGIPQLLIHTGQHYDDKMSDVFFRQLDLRRPDIALGVGSGSHASQTAAIMIALESAFREHDPRLVVVYGDVNSTLAGALVASKMGVPVAHVEAGLRSFDRSMPEEINRIITDSISDYLFTTSADANVHLGREGVDDKKVFFVGNPMIDTLLASQSKFDSSAVLNDLGLAPDQDYTVATLHRPGNVDDAEGLKTLVSALIKCAELAPIILPMHPRGRAAFAQTAIMDEARINIVEPLGYLEFMGLVKGAAAVVTDSGGVQEETTILGVPCLTLRPNTERPVTISDGTNKLVTPANVYETLHGKLTENDEREPVVPALWDGNAGRRIARIVAKEFPN